MKQYFIVIFIGLISLFSCSDDSKLYEVGVDFLETDQHLFQTDTITLEASTIIADSLITSDSGRLLIGKLQNETFGNLTSQSYLKYTPSTFTIDTDAVFDSVALVMHYDRYYYGDTTLVQTYKIHEVIEKFEPNDEDDDLYFYNTSFLDFDSEILGEASFTPYPNKKDSISITLKNEFGKSLFDKIKNNEIETTSDLEKEFRGITIVPENETNTILGFKYSTGSTYNYSAIRFFYSIDDDDDEDNDYILDFTLTGTNTTFNSITSDKSTTQISSLTDSEDILSSSNTSNKVYLQSGTGVAMRVDIPNLKSLNDLENDGTALSAVLKMYPDKNSYNEINLIDSLAVYVVDKKNRKIQQLTSYSGNSVYAQLISTDNEFDNNIYYTADVSYFTEEILTSSYNLDYSLMLEFPENTKSINQLLIHDSESPEDSNLKMKLILTYLTF
ncbi:protein of unknown function [Lutibacter oricola]|uniref:DUF4270 domain-containing protein n=1 Tax=Lutibacter oricola TaxID=762486 RepID=A0A1H2T3Z7_9FLAO|nr:DUF4270 family protein [Lutibacter oricola]SDW38578.1 protein of unknown function [Lutibacter oricola]